MGWLYGIPDVSFTNHFVYFKDLLEADDKNTRKGFIRKQQVGLQAQEEFNNGMRQLNDAHTQINDAVNFIQQIAKSEREKELTIVRSYCKRINKEFPFTEKEINENTILNDPENFYTKLTKLINEARQGVNDTIKELERIKMNAEGAKTKLTDYFKNDYRYRLNGDITSLLKKMIGTYTENDKSVNTYNQKVQEMALDIVNKTIGNKIANGEDYAAITTAVLVDIEREAQKILDDKNLMDFTELTDDMLQTLKTEYLKRLESENQKKENGIVAALQDINSDEFLRITKNVKKLLGFSTLDTESKEYERQKKAIEAQAKKRSNDTKSARKAVSNIQNKMKKKQRESLKTLSFTKFDRNSAHGNLQELVKIMLEENGIKAGETAATDVLSIQCEWQIKPNNNFINEILETIGDEMGQVIDMNEQKDSANEKDMRNKITKMNNNINTAIQKLEQKLQELNKESPEGEFFIFHESLKLYSSIETGVYKNWGGHASFGGRTLNILTYIDFLLSTAQAGGIDIPADRDLLIFLGLNLSKLAIGEEQMEPLTKYFSIFAGMLMFDDVVNMAKEAISNMPKTSIKQVHLYNLNGIYVPASMVLSYVGDALEMGSQEVSYGATATIESKEASAAIGKWVLKQSKDNFHPILGPNEWNEMGSKVASGTKVKIAFMASFLRFINKLADIG